MTDLDRVVVVGGGPTGVTAATLLAQYGVPVLLLERWAEVYPQPRAVHLDDEVHRILGRLGVAEEFATISRPALGLQLRDRRQRVLAEFGRDASTGPHGFPQANMFDQPQLEALLRRNLASHSEVEVRTEVDVVALRQGADEVEVDLVDQATGRRESVKAAYVLGCDGAGSIVRRSLGVQMEDLKFHQRWLVVDVDTDADLGQWEGVHQVCDSDRAATYMRIADRRYRWEFQLKDGESSADFGSIGTLRPLIAPWLGDTRDEQLEIVRVADYTFRAQLADRWRDARVFLLGDAAHLTPPFIGQGMGAGLRDAMNLAWKLAGVIDGSLPPVLLDSYQVERRPHARQLIRTAMVMGVLMTRGGRAGDLVRHTLARHLHRLPGVRERILDSASPRLPGRGLVGALAPNAEVAPGRRLDQEAPGEFVLITREPIVSDRAAVVVAESDSALGAWLDDAGVRAALVRPDGTVCAAGNAPLQVADASPRRRVAR